MRVLIGDDSLTHRVMLDAIVKQWGFETVLAEDGQQVWDVLSGGDAPRLVLLDWEMPGFDGLEVCRRVRARQDEDPPYILLLTARRETSDIVTGLEAGANDYVSKPFENTELHARLQVGRRMLDLQRALIGAREALEFQANHDMLTGLMNRGAIMRGLEREMERTRRSGQALQIGLLDIDHFKSINDTHGHLVGDVILQQVSQRIEATLRPYDQVGRYGGEEFLLLVNSEEKSAGSLFDRLQKAIAEKPFVHEGLSLEITVSAGVTEYLSEHELSATELLATADSALYQAKSEGRNRVVFRATTELSQTVDTSKTAMSGLG